MQKLINAVMFIFLAIIVGMLMFSLGGCKPVEKYKASPQFAKDCDAKYPVHEIIEYIQGKTDTVDHWVEIDCPPDTLIIDGDTVRITEKVTIKAQCPPSTNRVDTFAITKKAMAEIAVLENKILELEKENAKQKLLTEQAEAKAKVKEAEAKEWRAKSRKWFWWLIAFAGAVAGWTFRHGIIGLFTKK